MENSSRVSSVGEQSTFISSMRLQHQGRASLLFFFIYSAEKSQFSLQQVPEAARHEIRSFLNNSALKCDQKRPTMESYVKYGLHQIDNVGEMSKRQMFGFEFSAGGYSKQAPF